MSYVCALPGQGWRCKPAAARRATPRGGSSGRRQAGAARGPRAAHRGWKRASCKESLTWAAWAVLRCGAAAWRMLACGGMPRPLTHACIVLCTCALLQPAGRGRAAGCTFLWSRAPARGVHNRHKTCTSTMLAHRPLAHTAHCSHPARFVFNLGRGPIHDCVLRMCVGALYRIAASRVFVKVSAPQRQGLAGNPKPARPCLFDVVRVQRCQCLFGNVPYLTYQDFTP